MLLASMIACSDKDMVYDCPLHSVLG